MTSKYGGARLYTYHKLELPPTEPTKQNNPFTMLSIVHGDGYVMINDKKFTGDECTVVGSKVFIDGIEIPKSKFTIKK